MPNKNATCHDCLECFPMNDERIICMSPTRKGPWVSIHDAKYCAHFKPLFMQKKEPEMEVPMDWTPFLNKCLDNM